MIRELLIFSFLFACVEISHAENAETSDVDRQLKIGAFLPLTGPLSEVGLAMQNGIAIAEAENKETSKLVRTVYQDTPNDPHAAATNAESLTLQHDIDLLLNMGCPSSRSLLSASEKLGVPMGLYCSRQNLTKDVPLAFGLIPPSDKWADLLWTYLRKQGYKRMCVVLTKSEYLESEFASLKNAVGSSPLRTELRLSSEFAPDVTDFREAISKLRKSGCDALGMYLLPGQMKTFFRQMMEQRFRLPIFGTDILEDQAVIQAAGVAGIDGSVFVNLETGDDFRSKYVERFGNDHQIAAACIGYNFMSWVLESIRTHGLPPNGKELLIRLSGSLPAKHFCSAGTFVKSADGQQFMGYEVALKKILQGRSVRISAVPLEYNLN